MDMFMTKGNEFVWPKPENSPFLNGYQCKITNYGEAPVFNIGVGLEEAFYEVDHDPQQPNVMHAGQIKLARKWPITIPKIDAGVANAFVFYIFNQSETMVMVSLPEMVTLQNADNAAQNIRLVHSGSPSMQLWPVLR